MRSISWWPTLIVPAVVTVTDLRIRWSTNWLVSLILLRDSPSSGITQGMSGILQSLEGMCFGILLRVLCLLGDMGMRHVKLYAVIGAMDRPVVNWKQRGLRPQG
jgi:hypothetical protein